MNRDSQECAKRKAMTAQSSCVLQTRLSILSPSLYGDCGINKTSCSKLLNNRGVLLSPNILTLQTKKKREINLYHYSLIP